MSQVHVRKGDTVLIISGKDAGSRGKVLSVQPGKSRVIIEGVNKVKRHARPTRSMPQGGIIEKESSLHCSNVMLVCNKCSKPTRSARVLLEDQKKVRVCKKCGEVFD